MTDPLIEFAAWLTDAQQHEPSDPTAMALATATAQGTPNVRVVLMRGWDARGLIFYTHKPSAKGCDLAENPQACANFHWKSLYRQIRISGAVTPVSEEEADAYFAQRPRDNQLGAWASQQSQPLASRAALLAEIARIAERFQDQPVPRPPFWSGYRLAFDRMEFWRGEDNRWHERRLFLASDTGWTETLLNP